MKVLFGTLTSYKHGDLVLETSVGKVGKVYKMNLRLVNESAVRAGARSIFFTSYRDVWGIK